MIRLILTLIHTVLAIATTSQGVLFVLQAVAGMAWERSFYGVVSLETSSWLGASMFVIFFGVAHLVSVWAWALGWRTGGLLTLLVTAFILPSAPWSLVVLLGFGSLYVLADLLVMDAAPPE